MKPLTIICWALLFLSIPAAYNFAVTECDVEAPIAKPVYLMKGRYISKPKNGEFYYIGDCAAVRVPVKPSHRFAFSSISVDQLVPKISEIPCENPESLEATFVILIGDFDIEIEKQPEESLNAELKILENALRRRFPHCKIIAVPPYEIFRLAKHRKYSADGWHLTKDGYGRLNQKYSIF